MKDFTSPGAKVFLLKLCLCLFISSSLQAQIIFQHNFENLDNPPTDAQLSTPNIIHPDLTNIFSRGYPYSLMTDAGQKALSITASGTTSVYGLSIQSVQCRKLTISSISFKGFASNNASFSIFINDEPYGGAVNVTGNASADIMQTQKLNVGSVQDAGLGLRIAIQVRSAQNGTVSSIDDLTIEGVITNLVAGLGTMEFPYSTTVQAERCPEAKPVNYAARLSAPFRSINYVLDDASIAAGVSITNALIAFPPEFVGKTSITATATGCANDVLSKTFEVLTTPSGPPSSTELDYTTGIISSDCSTCGNLKNAKNPCFSAGFIYGSGFVYTSVDAKVRFEGGVRNFEITGSPRAPAIVKPGFDLYFRQSDFDNYRGNLPLPTGPSDEQGKQNLRLMIRADNPVNGYPAQNIKPAISWNEEGKWWVVSYQFSDPSSAIPWPVNNFKVFLSDSQVPAVKLESISGTHIPQGDLLNWKTSEEINVSHFELENSQFANQGFTNIATISSKKDPLGAEYSYTHIPSPAVKQYYRLKMVFSDNTFKYSKVVAVRSDIVYQHNFENLSNPSTESERSEPSFISPDLTSSWSGNSGDFISNVNWPRGKVLSFKTTTTRPSLFLKLKIPNCKKLEVTAISLDFYVPGPRKTGSSVNFLIVAANRIQSFDLAEGWTTLNMDWFAPNLKGEITIEISQFNYDNVKEIYLDDFTVYGNVTDDVIDQQTLNLPIATSRCQLGQTVNLGISNPTQYKSIQYSLDDISLAAGNQIEASTGIVKFAPTFSGESTFSANAVSCTNLPLSAQKTITSRPGGLPFSDMDFINTIPESVNECYGACDEIRQGCYLAGSVSLTAFLSQTVVTKLRFEDHVRNYEILGNPYTGTTDSPGFTLHYSQADFDNYHGPLPLPTGPDDEQGKANMMMKISFDDQDFFYLKPRRISWSDVQKMWVITTIFEEGESGWGAYRSTKVYLSDLNTSLPVKLESISAKSTPEGNLITWKTTEEINFSHFEIEKSEDPRLGFQYLATVSSAKNQNGSTYQYTDVPTSALQQYYRLKMVDFDGSFEYSKIVSAGGQLSEEPLLVYPNPAQNHIFLQSPDAVKSVRLVDQKGNEVFSRSFLDESKSLGIPLPKLNAGAYYLKVNSGAENQQVRKVIIR